MNNEQVPWGTVVGVSAGSLLFILLGWFFNPFAALPSRTACVLQGEVRTLTVQQVNGIAYRHELVRPVCFDKVPAPVEVPHG